MMVSAIACTSALLVHLAPSTSVHTAVSRARTLTPLASAAQAKEIFCNRALVMPNIQAVGFDMDYTLAEYIPETFDLLAFNGAITKSY